MKKNIFFVIVILCSIFLIGVYMIHTSSNGGLALSELKACFKDTVKLDYLSEIEEISEIQIGGAISMSYQDTTKYGNSVYNEKQSIKQITNYLNTISLVEASEDELQNKSPDAYIQYFGYEGGLLRNFIIYGQVFIKDVNTDRLYRIKGFDTGIIEGLEKLTFCK